MCGIVGFTGRKNSVVLREMSEKIIHRGPDDAGFYENDEIIGIVTILKNGKIAQLRGMAVADLHQGNGIGKQLVLEAEMILKKENLSVIS